MDLQEIKQLIAYHQNGLDEYRQHMSPAAQYLEEQTIKALKEQRAWMEIRAEARAKQQ